MRIISSFHDYYDCIQAQGQDRSLLYLRERKEVNDEVYPFPMIPPVWRPKLHVKQWIVGFCGKIYPVLNAYKTLYGSGGDAEALCYSMEDIDTFVGNHYNQREVGGYRSTKRYGNRRWRDSRKRGVFVKFFSQCQEQQSAFEEVFLPGCPVFVASKNRHNQRCTITHNDSLKDLGFYRVLDTYTAFQEISMYLGGQAQPNNPIPNVSDKDMVIAKGFDKFSFRKDPGKKARGK
jgi:hypothetical protein